MNPREDKELKNLAPRLAGLKKRELHKAPQGYFDGLAESVLAKINEAPVLFSLEKKELVNVPEGYFDNSDARIKQITVGKEETKIVSMRKTVLRWTAVAAGICFIITAAYVFSSDDVKPVAQTTVKEITNTETEITNYLLDEMHEDDLIAALSEKEADTGNNEVVDYLMEEDLELE